MQGRLFSYTDTQLIRLGGPNFHEIPINRPVAPVHNNQRDGFMRQTLNRGHEFVNEAYKHCKAIAASRSGVELLAASLAGQFGKMDASGKQVAINKGIVSSRNASIHNVETAFIKAIAQHRHWERENSKQ